VHRCCFHTDDDFVGSRNFLFDLDYAQHIVGIAIALV
jgi:hypothetical protein